MDISNSPCPICGQINYEFGYVNGKGPLAFYPPLASGNIINKVKTALSGRKHIKSARLCRVCGNVTIYVNPEDIK